MNKQEHYRTLYKKSKPDWTDSMTIFRNIIDDFSNENTKILDIGCGHGDFLKKIHDKTQESYGIDPDEDALNKNNFIKHKKVADACSLPFENNFFDLIVSAWVLEHISDPLSAFKEINRVLKPGGKVVFLTPNALNYNVWLIRIIPERFHDYFTKKLYNRKENDTYPKKYKVNTPNKIEKILSESGLNKSEIIINGDPSYISFNAPTFFFAKILESILDLSFLKSAKVHLIGVFNK